jgi:hypothetical protein
MVYTTTNSDAQPFSNKHSNKNSFDLTSLPSIHPTLISIATLASRFIAEMDDVYLEIITAESNDGKEITIPKRLGGHCRKPTWYRKACLPLDAAFDYLIYENHHSLMVAVMVWYQGVVDKRLSSDRILAAEFDIDPPHEIMTAIYALRQVPIKRKLLSDMVRNPRIKSPGIPHNHNLSVTQVAPIGQ